MGSLKTLAWAGLLAAASTTASAADLLPPPPAPVFGAPAHAPVEIGSGWYLRGDVGVGILQFDKFEGVGAVPAGLSFEVERKSIGDQVFIGAGAGFQFNAWLRADVTAEYRTMTQFDLLERASFNGATNGYNRFTGKLASFVFLANAYADLGTWAGITPFIGVGIGMANHKVANFHDTGFGGYFGGFGTAAEKSSSQLAWALHAGLAYSVSHNLKLELAYRYLNMGKAELGTIECVPACTQYAFKLKGVDSHDFKIGMRWLLAPPPPVATPVAFEQPIIRKY
ncbi:MAG TPA: outer membrane beta-barrel protein [Salinarimonas sp.]|nr:outer membrane beta-barrel protein [Salinarimonas sp.]